MIEKVFVINDLHIPYHDSQALSITLSRIKIAKPDRLIIDGDLVDFYSISSFNRDPLRSLIPEMKDGKISIKTNLQHEINEAYTLLKYLRNEFPNMIIEYNQGNHEFRLEKYLITNAKEIYGLSRPDDDKPILSVPYLLRLEDLGIKYNTSPTGEGETKVGKLFIGHYNTVRKHSGYTAKGLATDKGVSIMQGHTHRGGVSYETNKAGTIQAYENFCLCSLSPTYTSDPNWQHGFSIILHEVETGDFQVYPTPIIDNKLIAYKKRWHSFKVIGINADIDRMSQLLRG